MNNYFNKLSKFFLVLVMLFGTSLSFSKFENTPKKILLKEYSLYDELNLSQLGLNKDIFDKAVIGWNAIFEKQNLENHNLLSIADLSQSSNFKRLYIIDMTKKKILFNTYVAHGRNSGEEFAHSFSNKHNSYQSSLGFYLTENMYHGKHGLSMKLKGIEYGINDNAENRGIVMHGATYVRESYIKQTGRLGRSQGCPAIPQELCEPIIRSIKGGSCLFIFYPDSNYFNRSKLL
jgi:hypothetical protein